MSIRRLSPVLVGAALSLFGANPRIQRDWTKFPAVLQVDTTENIYAVGDVHGDYERLTKLLASAKLLGGVPASPEQPAWNGGRAVLVFTGDYIDKGPKGLVVLTFVRALQDAAARAGGQVIAIMGNHEAEFLASPGSPKVSDFAMELRRAGLKAREVAGCSGDVGGFLCSLPFGARVNDWFFSHAGNTGGRNLDRLSADLRSAVDKDGFSTPELIDDDSFLEARLDNPAMRTKSWFELEFPKRTGEQVLTAWAGNLGVAHLVQGHHHDEVRFRDGGLRKPGEMYQRWGRLFLIDTGLSRGIGPGGGPTLLHIDTKAKSASAVCTNGKSTLLWDAASNQVQGAAKVCGY